MSPDAVLKLIRMRAVDIKECRAYFDQRMAAREVQLSRWTSGDAVDVDAAGGGNRE